MARLALKNAFMKKLESNPSSLKTDSERDTWEDFVHQPLDLETKTIRVLRILPGKSGSVIRCELTHQPLRDDHTCLSYAWGDEHDPKTILVNGKKLTIRRNIFDFLHLARKHKLRHQLWIDAICIDQSNTNEKNHQVRQMGQIYQQARLVLIWTGAILSWNQLMIHYIKRFIYKLFNSFRFVGIYNPRRRRALRYTLFGDGSPITQSEYWTRMWVVQEVLLARRASVFIGSSKLSVAGVLDVAWAAGPPDYIDSLNGCWNFAFYMRLANNTLSKLLVHFGNQQCTDRRDRIYSLLGLVDLGNAFRVDYREDVITVFMRATQSIWTVDAGAGHVFGMIDLYASVVSRSLELRSATFCKHYLRYRRVPLRKLGHATMAPTSDSQAMLEILMVVFDLELNSPIREAAWEESRVNDGWDQTFYCDRCRDCISTFTGNTSVRFVARHGYCHLWIQVPELPAIERKVRRSELMVLDEACTGPRDPSDVQDEEVYLRLLNPPKDWRQELAAQMAQVDTALPAAVEEDLDGITSTQTYANGL